MIEGFFKVFVIAKNTFREAVRDRILYNLVLFFFLMTASAILLGDLTAGNEARTIVNFGLGIMLLFGVFIAIFVGVGLLWKEIDRKTIYAFLAKPVTRAEFVIGRYLGLCLVLLVNTLVMGTGISLALIYVQAFWLAFVVWGAVILIYLQLALMISVAIMFSSFSTPTLSALFSFSIFLIGHFSSSLRDIAESIGSKSAKIFFNVLYYVLPNLAHFSFITNAAHGQLPTPMFLLSSFFYAVLYIFILVTIATLIFNRRDFK
jgi:ABC-type transport system involved in multi-copper enzyme maturation permease subunit